MERQSEILTTAIHLEGVRYTADYFVERDMLYANIGGRIMLHALGPRGAEETVKSLLLGFAETDRYRSSLLQTWDPAHANPG